MMRLLLIEDNRDIAVAIIEALASSYSVALASSGQEALTKVGTGELDGIILDLNLPDITGLELCQSLRSNGCDLPLLVLSADNSVMSKIRLLDAGADDYLTKPFSLGELKARLRVLLRNRTDVLPKVKPLQVGDLVLDPNTFVVQREGQIIQLRRKEYALLECLMQNAGAVVSRTALGNYAWHGDSPWANTIDVHIKYLRDKIDRPFARPLIRTVHGFGYKLETEISPVLEKV
jgi:DNA-binding response OmpR family regulator